MISAFAVVFTGALSASKYNQDVKGGLPEQRHMDGHWAWRRRSSKSGQPEPVWIDNFATQAQFCKEEGLVNPRDLPSNLEAGADGKSISTRGMPGCW